MRSDENLHERFVGGSIEYFGSRFPLWIAPEQVALIPIREQHADYVRELSGILKADQFRVGCMDEAGHMNKKIQTAEKARTPYMLIAGDREVAERTVAVRRRGSREQTVVPFEKFHALVKELRASRSLELPAPTA